MRAFVILAWLAASIGCGEDAPVAGSETGAEPVAEAEPTEEPEPEVEDESPAEERAEPAPPASRLSLETPGTCAVVNTAEHHAGPHARRLRVGMSPDTFLVAYPTDGGQVTVVRYGRDGQAIAEPVVVEHEQAHRLASVHWLGDRWLLVTSGTCHRNQRYCSWVRSVDASGAAIGDVHRLEGGPRWDRAVIDGRRVYVHEDASSRNHRTSLIRYVIEDDGTVTSQSLVDANEPESSGVAHVALDGERFAYWTWYQGYGEQEIFYHLGVSEHEGPAVELRGLRGVDTRQIAFVGDAIRMTYTRGERPPGPPRTMMFAFDGERQGESQPVEGHLAPPNDVGFERTENGVRRVDDVGQPIGDEIVIDGYSRTGDSDRSVLWTVGDLDGGIAATRHRDGAVTTYRVSIIRCALE